ncbi:MAG: NAD-dependent epimerase/dehydratase family protein [Pseudomonadota bacterium]
MEITNKTICVAGASGLVGANLVKYALENGYHVNGTFRNIEDPEKAPYLKALPGADSRLKLFSANMANPGDFDEALQGVDAVFIACLIPTYFGPNGKPAREMDDEQGHTEIVMPTVDGCLNILRSAAAAKVKNVLICSSTSSTNPIPPVAKKNEVDHWSDQKQQYAAKKYTSAAKTVMEPAAMKFAEEHGMRLSIFLPTLMLGPAVLPEHSRVGFQGALKKMITDGATRHEKIPNDSNSMIHVQDLAKLFFAAYENPAAQGRYFGVYESWHWQDIYSELAKLIPDLQIPASLTEAPAEPTGFDFTRRDSLGVTLRDIPTILRETVEAVRQEG